MGGLESLSSIVCISRPPISPTCKFVLAVLGDMGVRQRPKTFDVVQVAEGCYALTACLTKHSPECLGLCNAIAAVRLYCADYASCTGCVS